MNFFYNPNVHEGCKQFTLEPEEGRHIVKVLRKQSGAQLHITNGRGQLFKTVILEANPKKCTVQVLEYSSTPKPEVSFLLAVAPTKRIERFQWLLEKATEIGITRFIPLICERSERQTLPEDRLQRVIQEAMKQSLQTWLPVLSPPTTFTDFIGMELPEQRYIAHCEPEQKKHLMQHAQAGKDTVILIGPEGDFTKDEIAAALQRKFVPVALGNHRLRTETAAITASAALNLINQF
ncbi:MAG: hypothetical protein RLZZ241_924 [Bacteroidota bacterium]|jgi:16S rRNA (uracil1498-N3)-methyltransferase